MDDRLLNSETEVFMDTVRVKTISIRRLKPAPYNPRIDLRPGDPEYEKLRRSLDTFGCVEPLVWNERTGHVVGGHQRLKVMQAEGIKQVKVSVVDLSLTDEKALNVALNKIEGGWDDDKLAALLQELTELPDFDATLTGFDADETSQLLDGLLETGDDDEFDLADDLDRHRQYPAITKKGDLIRVGDHRLLCGDSASAADLDTLLDGESVNLLFTDPPYNVNYYGGNRPTPKSARPKPSRNWERIYMDNLSHDLQQQLIALRRQTASQSIEKFARLYFQAHLTKPLSSMHQEIYSLLDLNIERSG